MPACSFRICLNLRDAGQCVPLSSRANLTYHLRIRPQNRFLWSVRRIGHLQGVCYVVTTTRSVVGRAIAREEGPDKVTGTAQFAADVLLPGMIFGKVLRSPVPHARIVSIDTSRVW